MRALYPHQCTHELAAALGRSYSSVCQQAYKLMLRKTPEYLATEASGRKQKGCTPNAGSFRKGLTPHNAGRSQQEWLSPAALARVRTTQFKAGQLPHNTKWDGYERINIEGYTEVRVALGRFVLKHRLIWEQHHGPIPQGGVVVFVDGNKQNFDPANLQLISRTELIAGNSIHNYPAELAQLMRLHKKLVRKLKKIDR